MTDRLDRLVKICGAVWLLAACEAPMAAGPVTFTIASAPPPTSWRTDRGVRILNFDHARRPLARFDLAGNSLDAHDGEIERFGDLYYLYGASYGCGFEVTVPDTPFCGIKVYSSPDLLEWTDRGVLFDPASQVWQQRCHGGRYGCFRPHVAFSPATQRYVLWLNTYEVPVGLRVFEANAPTGPFLERTPPILATNRGRGVGHTHGDHNLFVDDDGTGYLVYTDWVRDGDLVVEELTPDLLSGTGRNHRLNFRATEAPSLFKRRGVYYLIFSDPNCGYCRTGTSYVAASHPLGPWGARERLSDDSCGGQPAHVATLPSTGGDSVYLYQSDLWIDFELNQAPAAHYWEALEFTPGGRILPLGCAPSEQVPIQAPGGPTSQRLLRAVLRCDVRTAADGGPRMRESRFALDRDRVLRTVRVPVYQRGRPTRPLVLEVLSGSRILRTVRIDPGDVSWNARTLEVPVRVRLSAGLAYAIRFSTDDRAGCYGFADFVHANPASAPQIRSGHITGAGWSPDAELAMTITLEFSDR